ncbi:MAG: CBS domain-containing protein [Gammaproteobacteria bacterium]|nr:CBS domain-containing protein [Gammaproteobacteria bacterium]NND53688.1 CBS domain-containing protein [Gammaproteobacteria bacterium]
MAVVEVRRRVKAHISMVWSIVSDLEGDPGLPPAARRMEMLETADGSLRRRLTGRDGNHWEEERVGLEEGRLYSMAVTGDFPVPAAQLRYTCSVAEDAGTVLIRLYFDYRPKFGVLGRMFDRFSGRSRLQTYAMELLDNWVRIIHAREWAYRVTARSIIEEKGGHVHAVAPSTSVSEVVQILREHRIGSVLVLDDHGNIAGVLSERDVVRGLAEESVDVLNSPASAIMTTNVITAGPDDNMMSVMACMSDRRIRHLPVVEDDQVLGLISIGDVIKARISELEGESETLLDYIEARRWHELYKEVGPAAYAES